MFRPEYIPWNSAMRCWILLAGLFHLTPGSLGGQEPAVIRSAQSGEWSKAATWEGGKVPGEQARVQIRPGHTVRYDVAKGPVLRVVHVGGTLTFARDQSTQMDVGLLKVQPGDTFSEEGFDCDAHVLDADPGTPQAALLVGTSQEPIPFPHTAVIRLHYIPGTDRQSWPALVCCGGRMDLHGVVLNRTWVKLGASAPQGAKHVELGEGVTGWKKGDRLLVTASHSDGDAFGTRRPGRSDRKVQTEVRILQEVEGSKLTLDQPLQHQHLGQGDFRSAVANLSRNVVVESADPAGVRGHTMYHRGSSGAISYAEFRHLGKEGVLGRYSIHFHLVGNTMRGSYVLGASIWDSHNRWVTVHGTNFLVVRDCVGYQSVGHGFFLEDGTEIYNVFDRNLAVQAFLGRKLPNQVLPFDENEGAGFWWTNSLNSFTRNSTVENDRYGYRYEATPLNNFRLTLPVLLPSGQRRLVDVRTLPFIRFDDNEAMANGLYGLNLGEGTQRFGPDPRYPFIIRNFKAHGMRYAFRPQVPNVLVDGLHIHECEYGIYHPNYDRHVYQNVLISGDSGEPFNRGHDDDDIQYGSVTVDGLTLEGMRMGDIAMIQLTDNNPSGRAETHIKNLKILKRQDEGKRAVVDRGGSARPDPETPFAVPLFLHDYYGEGRHAKVVSVTSKHLRSEGLNYRHDPALTGSEARVAEVRGVDFPTLLRPEDNMPPGTIITHVLAKESGKWLVRGTTIDNGKVMKVLVNEKEAKALRPNFAEWEINLESSAKELEISARAFDAAGNEEMAPHRVSVRK